MMRHRPGSQGGTTLVEALVTFLVLSLGLLAVSRVQGQLRLTGDTGRQRSEAVRLAQEDVERLRGFARLVAPPGTAGPSYADVASGQRTIDAASGQPGNTVYRLTRQVDPSTVSSARNVSVSVEWTDRGGALQTVRLETILAANDPALSGALGIAPAVASVNGPMGRAVQIPASARNLGDGRSAFALGGSSDNGGIGFLLDNATGVVTERCVGGSAAATGSPADLGVCHQIDAYLLAGVVRFATGPSVDAIEPVRRASVVLRTSGVGQTASPECSTTPVAAADGDRYLQYVCIVYPAAGGRWSGESQLVPDGWTLAAGGPAGLQICSEGGGSSSAGVSGAGGAGQLARYAGVSGTLVNQNFRVIRADLACPA